jgi:hypothetical protein
MHQLPARIGPVEFAPFGPKWVAVRCQHEFELMRRTGGLWLPDGLGGKGRWLIERRRIGPLVRNLRRDTDPLFRRAGTDLI